MSENLVIVSGNPPVRADHMSACTRLLADFAAENNVPTPFTVDWTEFEGNIHFMGVHDGRVFTIGAPKTN